MKKIFLPLIFCLASFIGNAQTGDKAKLNAHKIKIEQLFTKYEKQMNEAVKTLESMRKALEMAMKDLETQNKLTSSEGKDLMIRFNQAETLLPSVLKEIDVVNKSVFSKMIIIR